jgi:hypothetical protein
MFRLSGLKAHSKYMSLKNNIEQQVTLTPGPHIAAPAA